MRAVASGFGLISIKGNALRSSAAVASMAESGEVSEAELDAIDDEVMALIEESVTAAKSAPRPAPSEVDTDVYVNYQA